MRTFSTILCFIALNSCVSAQDIVIPMDGMAMPRIGVQQLGPPAETADQPVIGFTLPTMPDDEFKFLVDPSVVKDLEIVPEQSKQIAEIQGKFGQAFNSLVQKLMSNGTDPTKQDLLRKEIVNFHNQRTEAIKAVLLPHQLTRVRQINQQMVIQFSGGISGAFQTPAMAKQLSLRNEQIEELKEIQSNMKKEIAEKIEECKEAARKKALSVLDSEQQSALRKLTGDRFVRKADDWNERYGNVEKNR